MIADGSVITTVKELLAWGQDYLNRRGIASAGLDSEILLMRTLAVERTALHTHPRTMVRRGDRGAFRRAVFARGDGRPIAHLTGEQEFYGHPFAVTPDVLIPRPETELLVEWAMEWLRHAGPRQRGRPLRVADIGTGSGCIIVALAREIPSGAPAVELVATDCCPVALRIARRNALRNGVAARIAFHCGDLLSPLGGKFDLIISNPPYVAPGDPRLDPHVAAFEPRLALMDVHDGDGLGFFRRFVREAPDRLGEKGALLLEVGDGQAPAVREMFAEAGFRSEVRQDLARVERAILVQR